MWQVKTRAFKKDDIISNGNKFLSGNGFMGYRGTLEEFEETELVSLNLPGVYDRFEDKWRESVNAPNPFYTVVYYNKQALNPLKKEPIKHQQTLDISCGCHKRQTTWKFGNKEIEIHSERFLSLKNINIMAMKYTMKATKDLNVTLETGIDGDVWDINGPHLEHYIIENNHGQFTFFSHTREKQIPVIVKEAIAYNFKSDVKYITRGNKRLRQMEISLKENEEVTLYKFAYVNHHEDDSMNKATEQLSGVVQRGYEDVYYENKKEWDKRWELSDVEIEGDEEGQFALRYSIYHLIILSQQHSDKVSIPARGISGQVYKGAIFWDTEMFMLPFYLLTDLKTAKNLVKYRINTLDGARRKAKEYGYSGAFYAWEAQETGDDACTHFNVTDVFTNRPMRTYFRDKQIHISADIAYAIWNTYKRTLDSSLLIQGGAEVILECARFYISYGYQKMSTKRFELLDVTGPDEYHERVNNNAFTNKMVQKTFKITLELIDLLKDKYPQKLNNLLHRLDYSNDELYLINEALDNMYIQEPNDEHIIEQFDGYFKLEDTTVDEVRSRLLHPNEYWGGANGVASSTQIIKQADVVTMLYLFKEEYNDRIKKANWDYYERRTEHGSSLSACMYALVACEVNNPDWAYPYFLKTATVDLTGKTKQYAGGIYIGGTHPAASGGAYMTAIFGFAGLSVEDNEIKVNPRLPKKWQGMSFKVLLNEKLYKIEINQEEVTIKEME